MTIPAEQEIVARFLSKLADCAPIETHISAVFVGKDTVWKLKKAVQLPFLDFSSLDAREFFLRRELALNKASAPAIYRDVIAVSRQTDGSLALGDGQPIDWVMRMARVPSGDFLNLIADRGDLTPNLLDAVGDCVVSDQDRRPVVHGWDSAAALSRVTDGNARSALAAGLPAGRVADWRQRMQAAIAALRPWLSDRAASGCVRRCHGDLHLQNICLWDGHPVPFDALEFDEALATIDTGYDLAFLLMDLDQCVGRAAANRVLNRTIARRGDAAMTQGLPVFMSERAMIRAHVAAASGQTAAASRYLAAASDYLMPAPPLMIAIGGLQGTGKSTLARLLAPTLGRAPGAVVLRSDELRKRLHDIAPEERLPPSAYQEDVNQMVNAALLRMAGDVAAGGHAVIMDATFLDPKMRQCAENTARAVHVPFLGIWLQAPLPVLEQRISLRRDDASDATLDVLHRSAAANAGPINWMQIDATDRDDAAAAIRTAVATRLG